MNRVDPRYLGRTTCDFSFVQTGSFTIISPEHDAVDGVLLDLCPDGMFQGNSLICEDRYAPELSLELCRDGYRVMLPGGRVVSEQDIAS